MLVLTADGSHTLFVPELKEHYHSVHGALTESEHIFIKHGFGHAISGKKDLKILEIGFGTGLNALLTLAAAEPLQVNVCYHTLEPAQLAEEIWQQLNYPGQTGLDHAAENFARLHRSEWNETVEITAHFMLRKISATLQDFDPAGELFDLIYFDAFGPKVQPDLWTNATFGKISSFCRAGSILVTYSAKGSVKRALTENGFRVKRLPGPPGKRHMLQAIYQPQTIIK